MQQPPFPWQVGPVVVVASAPYLEENPPGYHVLAIPGANGVTIGYRYDSSIAYPFIAVAGTAAAEYATSIDWCPGDVPAGP